jgi:hypothetical protein
MRAAAERRPVAPEADGGSAATALTAIYAWLLLDQAPGESAGSPESAPGRERMAATTPPERRAVGEATD